MPCGTRLAPSSRRPDRVKTRTSPTLSSAPTPAVASSAPVGEKLVQYAATHLDTVPQDALEVLGLDEEEEEEQPVPMQG